MNIRLPLLIAALASSLPRIAGSAETTSPPEPVVDRPEVVRALPSPTTPRVTSTSIAVFDGVSVVSMLDSAPVANQRVVIADGRIAAFGPRQEVAIPDGAQVIPGEGRWLMPGLADLHTHVWSPNELLLLLANGVTTTRNMAGSPFQLIWRAQIAAGTLVGPRMLTAGPIVDGPHPVWPGSEVVRNADEARAAVGRHHAAGYDFIKVYDGVGPEAYSALLAEAARLGTHVSGHLPQSVSLDVALAGQQRTLEHLAGSVRHGQPELTSRGAWGAAHALEADAMTAWAAAMAASQTWSCPTLVVRRGLLPPNSPAPAPPHLRYIDPSALARWAPGGDQRLTDWTPADWEANGKAAATQLALVAALHRAGGRILLGTDAGNPWVVHGYSVHDELALLVEAGLSPFDALTAGTRAAGEVLEEPDTGVIAVGARADLLLLDANPLQSVAHVQMRAGVMAAGVWYAEAELVERLEKLARSYGNGL